MKRKQEEIAEAKRTLLEMLKPGDTVYTVLRSVSRSGMSRTIGLLVPVTESKGFFHPNYSASILLGCPQSKHGDGVKVSGCGMDMGFHVVHSLSMALFPEGFGCIGPKCPSNDHSNGDRDYWPHSESVSHWHKSGGYALRHEWV